MGKSCRYVIDSSTYIPEIRYCNKLVGNGMNGSEYIGAVCDNHLPDVMDGIHMRYLQASFRSAEED